MNEEHIIELKQIQTNSNPPVQNGVGSGEMGTKQLRSVEVARPPSRKKTMVRIYLLKPLPPDGDAHDYIKEDKGYQIIAQTDDHLIIVPAFNRDRDVNWNKTFFGGIVGETSYTAAPAALMIMKRQIDGKDVYFALTFGSSAKGLLKDDSIVERFGLKTILNLAKPDSFKRVSLAKLTGNHKQTEERLLGKGTIDDFGFDVERDLVKEIGTSISNPILGEANVMGSDCLSFATAESYLSIGNALDECYRCYGLDTYKEKYWWLDNIKMVPSKNTAVIDELDRELLHKIKSNQGSDIIVAMSKLYDFADVIEFKLQGDKNVHKELPIDVIRGLIRDDAENLSVLKRKTVTASLLLSTGETVSMKRSAYECLNGQIEFNGHVYCLSEGKWYEVDASFVEGVENQYKSIELLDAVFPDSFKGEIEDDYNTRLAQTLTGAIYMHKATITLTPGNQMEACDIYCNDNFIHIKRQDGSGVLSHLFNQGYVAGRALHNPHIYAEFYQKAQERFREKKSSCCVPEMLNRNGTTIVFGIIGNSNDGRPHIPFFSKIAIGHVARELRSIGYSVKLKPIGVVKKMYLAELPRGGDR